ncbi:MAG: hypothetical protein ACK4JF_02795 [Methylohalobius sp.]
MLTEKVERLAALCEQLRIENRQLKEQIVQLITERDQYLAKTQSARKRIKQMLDCMQSLTQ